jgi:uncharacterized repeat protein (TIGR03833 family)
VSLMPEKMPVNDVFHIALALSYCLWHKPSLYLEACMNGQHRNNVRAGGQVDIILKNDQASGKLTRGIVKDILTKSSFHPNGIKVRLVSGDVGRVQQVFDVSDEKR